MGSEVSQVVGIVDRPYTKMEGESLGRALLRFESGKVAYLEASIGEQVFGPDQSWRVLGSEGEIIIDTSVRLYNAEHPDGIDAFATKPASYDALAALGVDISFEGLSMPVAGYMASFGEEIGDFARAVLHGSSPLVPTTSGLSQPEHALGEMCTALALYRSAESGRWEDVFPEGFTKSERSADRDAGAAGGGKRPKTGTGPDISGGPDVGRDA